ncbi:hypothetical protein [Motilimonas eburnea]|uniref:hypothetical protein n=1 Tax=Motilimonas eburnea TaxID=1737488 RepID=UPI001E3CD1EF|nr:hypothetical protein [Motilimonas eburnea]MCE2571359.1 hypothetical protein [Motilimonas eburnea]
MRLSLKIAVMGAIALLQGCQTTPYDKDYQYVPTTLPSELVKELSNTPFLNSNGIKDDIEYRFVPDQSYVEIIHIAGPDHIYRQISEGRLLKWFCEGDNPGLKNLRDNGVGVKLVFQNIGSRLTAGPWNKDACPST